jgi:hypothetical protein
MNAISLAVFVLGVVTFVAGMVMLGIANRLLDRAIGSREETLEMIRDHRADLQEWTTSG